jgi:hypothetical protein
MVVLVFLGLVVCAFIFPLRKADKLGVHPLFADLKEPVRVTGTRYYLDGGSIGLQVVDGRGLTNLFAFPVGYGGYRAKYSHFVAGVWHTGTNTHDRVPLDEQTRRYVCYLVETKSAGNIDEDLILVNLRGAPRDYASVFIAGLQKLFPFGE